MLWTEEKQLLSLLPAIFVGVGLGVVLDIFSSCSFRRRKWRLIDTLFGPFAALITFGAALVILDGQLHPLLFGGMLVGIVLERQTIGIWLRFAVRHLRKTSGRMRKTLANIVHKSNFNENQSENSQKT